MSETTGTAVGVRCPLCGQPAHTVHTPRFKEALPLYQGPAPTSFLGTMKEGGPFGAPRAVSASGKELAVPGGEEALHCPACRLIVFRYEG